MLKFRWPLVGVAAVSFVLVVFQGWLAAGRVAYGESLVGNGTSTGADQIAAGAVAAYVVGYVCVPLLLAFPVVLAHGLYKEEVEDSKPDDDDDDDEGAVFDSPFAM